MDNDDHASPSSTTISNFTSPRTVAPTSVSNDTSANFTVAPTSVPSTNDTLVNVPSDEGTVDVDPSDESVLATAAEESGSPTTTAAVVPIAGMGGVLTAVLFFW